MKTKITILSLLSLATFISQTNAQTSVPNVNQTTAISLISADSAPPESKSKSKVWAYTFGDYAFAAHGDSAGRGTSQEYKGLDARTPNSPGQNQNAFEIRRAYLGYDYKINSSFSGAALLAYEGDNDANNNRTVYLKEAYLSWNNIFKGSVLKIGQQATNTFSNAYNTVALDGYRAIEKSIMDMHKVDGSSDMGLTLEGRLWTNRNGDSNKAHSFIGYSVMVGDNSGNIPVAGFSTSTVQPLNGTTDRDKIFRGNAYVNTLNGALTLGLVGDYINYGPVFYKTAKGYQNANYTLKGYGALNEKWFGFGFEWFKQVNTNGEIEVYKNEATQDDTVNAVQSGLSLFAHATIFPRKLNIFVRYDIYKPDAVYKYSTTETFTSRLQPGATWTETFINGGLDWTPKKDRKVHFMPNVWYYRIDNAYGSDALKSDYYLVYRLTFLYIMN